MSTEKTHYDYGRLPDWQRQLLRQCAGAVPAGSRIVEISSDFPRFSGAIQGMPGADPRAVSQFIRGPSFECRGDNFFAGDIGRPGVAGLQGDLSQADVGFVILDTTPFLSELVNEYNAWSGLARPGCRWLLPLQGYGISRGEQLHSLSSLILREALTADGLQLPQTIGTLFTGVSVQRGRQLQLPALQRAAVAVFEQIRRLRDAHGPGLQAQLSQVRSLAHDEPELRERLVDNEQRSGVDMLCFSYMLQAWWSGLGQPFKDFCQSVLAAKYPAARAHYQFDLSVFEIVHGQLGMTSSADALDLLVAAVPACADLPALEALIAREQMRLLLLQELANPLYYVLMGTATL